MHGQWAESLSANLGGFFLALYSLGFACVCGHAGLTGRMPSFDIQRVLGVALLAIASLTLLMWAWRLFG
tara:strand:+ start:172222 stop:172428 length:207 start_codon:yes stop_codon:yes gene_type:complete